MCHCLLTEFQEHGSEVNSLVPLSPVTSVSKRKHLLCLIGLALLATLRSPQVSTGPLGLFIMLRRSHFSHQASRVA